MCLNSKQTRHCAEFAVLPAVVIKSSIFWDIMPYSLLKLNQCRRGTCRLHFRGQRICQARNQHEAGICCLFHAGFDPEDGDMFLSNVSQLLKDYMAL